MTQLTMKEIICHAASTTTGRCTVTAGLNVIRCEIDPSGRMTWKVNGDVASRNRVENLIERNRNNGQ